MAPSSGVLTSHSSEATSSVAVVCTRAAGPCRPQGAAPQVHRPVLV